MCEVALPDGETVEEIHEDHHDQEDKGEEEGVGERREGALQIHWNVAEIKTTLKVVVT